MKLSKKYPAIALLKTEKKYSPSFDDIFDIILSSGLTKDIRPLKEVWRKMYCQKKELINGMDRAKWYEPCQSLLEDAGNSYEKLSNIKINKGVYIISGLNFFSDGLETVALASVSGKGDISIVGVSGLPIPDITIQAKYGGDKIQWFHSSLHMGAMEDQQEQVNALFYRVVAVLLFLQNCGPEAKEMMNASVPKKRTTLRKVVNDLGIKRIRLTASWYRDTVQGHPFMVSGHWRKQRHGEGLKKVKRKFITPYMKDGYRSKPQRDNVE